VAQKKSPANFDCEPRSIFKYPRAIVMRRPDHRMTTNRLHQGLV
jgi:hypothetical protein